MDQTAAQFGIVKLLKQSSAFSAELLKPVPINRRELVFKLFAHTLRQSRAQPARGNRNLEVAPAHNRRIKEVTVLRVIDNIAEDAAPMRFPADEMVYFRGRGRGYYQENAVKIGGLERLSRPDDLAFSGSFRDTLFRYWRHHNNFGPALNQAVNLRLPNTPRPNDEARPAVELQKHRE